MILWENKSFLTIEENLKKPIWQLLGRTLEEVKITMSVREEKLKSLYNNVGQGGNFKKVYITMFIREILKILYNNAGQGGHYRKSI